MMPMSYFEGKGEEIVIKAPRYSVYSDYDYIGFTFNGKHACEDLEIFRTSESNRYNEELNLPRKEQTAQHSGNDYTHFINETFGPRKIKVNFAFERLNEAKIRKIRDCFDDKEIHPLWFDEAPYKVYEAKVQGAVVLKTIPFDDGSGGTVYNGEGSVTFVCYCPYARTPDYVTDQDGKNKRNGKQSAFYRDSGFKNVDQWKGASGLDEGVGEVPFYFEATIKDEEPTKEAIIYQESGDYLIYTYDPELNGYICSGDPDWSGTYDEDTYNSIKILDEINNQEGYPNGPVVRIEHTTFNKFKNVSDYLEYDKKNNYLGSKKTFRKSKWLIKVNKDVENKDLNDIFSNGSISGIADKAIYACKNVNNLNLNGVQYIGEYAFQVSEKLETLYVSKDLEYIGSGAFLYCWKISEINFGTEKEPIYENEIYKYDNVNNFLINKKTKTLTHGLPGSVFSNIKDVGVRKIEAEAFRNRGGSGKLELPEGLVEIGANAFQNTNFNTIILPSTIKKLSNYAFAQMTNLTTVSTPEGVSEIQLEEIGDQVFNNKALASFPFEKCLNLKSIGHLGISYGSLTKIDLSNLLQLKSLGSRAFSYQRVLETITLPENLESIGNFCFDSSKITSLTIPASVTFMGRRILEKVTSSPTIKMENTNNWFYRHYESNGDYTKKDTEFVIADFQNDNFYYNLGDKLYSVKATSNEISQDGTIQTKTIDKKEMQLIGVNSDDYKKIFWNSKTGIISGVREDQDSGENIIETLPAKGTVYGPLTPAKNIETNYIQDIKYHYWYY